ncbi:MAG: OmpA family protein [Nitrospiraceae bacterium]|nr:OmpA family protein [Nitrospiraceae bacterium]
MYIRVRGELGEDTASEPWRTRLGLRPKPQYLRFLNLDQFDWNKASLTPRLRQMVGHLAKHVQLSWKSMRPIGFIRLIGHTDNTGPEKYNVDLGDRRARAVKEELENILQEDILKGRIRIAILVDPSPGASAPTAGNSTGKGRALNRRVEVFIAAPEPPPEPKKKLNLEIKVPEPPPDLLKPGLIPPARRGKSLEDLLDEWGVPPIFRDPILTGACWALEVFFRGAGGTLSEEQKEELRKRCRELAKRPL